MIQCNLLCSVPKLTRIFVFKMADEREFYVCQCFFTHNIFLKNYEAHVVFESEEKFQYDYRRVCSDFYIFKLVCNVMPLDQRPLAWALGSRPWDIKSFS